MLGKDEHYKINSFTSVKYTNYYYLAYKNIINNY